MITRLLALIGTSLLALLAAGALWLSAEISRAQPALPVFEVAEPDSSAAAPRPAQTGRPPRPDIYYDALVQRPVFAPGRRPIAPQADPTPDPAPAPAIAPAPQTPPAPPPPALSLLGVMGDARGNRALVSQNGGDPIWLNPDDTLSGWTVSDIGPDWLEISRENETLRIEMYQ